MTIELCVLPSVHLFTTKKLKRNINLRPFTLKFDQHRYKKMKLLVPVVTEKSLTRMEVLAGVGVMSSMR